MAAGRQYTADEVIDALKHAHGLVSIAAQSLGCSVKTVHNHINRNGTVAAALKEARDAMTDTAESALFRQIQAGEGWAVCFYLKTQGKSRGYVERQELTGADGEPLTFALIDRVLSRADSNA